MKILDHPLIRVEQLSLKELIGNNYLLKDISFEAWAGDRIAIIGPSGAGKTSLLRLLNRLLEPSSGSIYLESHDYRQIPVIELRRQVMLVPQEPRLLGMSVQAALAYPLVLQQLPKSTIQERLIYWMQQLRIPEDWLDRTELQLSLGQRQLVAIARALVTQPKVLLLDEPTSALDAGRAANVLNVLSNLAQTAQMAILMVNHQLDLAETFSSKVLYLQAGELVEEMGANQVEWQQMRDRLIQAEAQAAQEWE